MSQALPFATPAPSSVPNKRDLQHLYQDLEEVKTILDSCVLKNLQANARHTPRQQQAPLTREYRLNDSQLELLSGFPIDDTLHRIGELREVLYTLIKR
jgi:hypothetical protein